MATYHVNAEAVAHAERLIDARQYVLVSEWGTAQPKAADENAYLESHSFEEYARWHLGLTEGANDGTKARYAFVYGDFRRVHRMGLIACHYRAYSSKLWASRYAFSSAAFGCTVPHSLTSTYWRASIRRSACATASAFTW